MLKAIVVLATFYVSFFSSLAHAMNDLKLTSATQDEWDNYTENGRLVLPRWAKWVDISKTYTHHQILQRMNDLDEIIDNPSTDAVAQQLDDLPSNEIVRRYENYKKVFDSFISLLIIKQYASNVIQKYPEPHPNGFSEPPSNNLQHAEQRMTATVTWLDAIRKSGEELYLGISNLAVAAPATTPRAFWHSTMENDVLRSLRNCYWDETTHLDPTSMAMLRHQLRKGFQEENSADR